MILGLYLGKGKRFSSSQNHPDRLWGALNIAFKGCGDPGRDKISGGPG